MWVGLSAVVVLLATLAVPFVRSGVTGTAQRGWAQLTTTYPTAPTPGVLLDLNGLLGIDEPVQGGGAPAWVSQTADGSALVVTPSGAMGPTNGTSVLAVVLETDGTERWRFADDDVADASNRYCVEAGPELICYADQPDGDLRVIRIRIADGVVQSDRTLERTTVGGPIGPELSDGVLLLRDGQRAVLEDPVADTELWSIDLSTWAEGEARGVWASLKDGLLVVTADFTQEDAGNAKMVSALVDPDTGELQWRSTSGLGVQGGRLYESGFGPNSDGLRRLDDVGVPIWAVDRATLVGWSDAGPVLEVEGRLQVLDPDTGVPRWTSAETYDDVSWLREDPAGQEIVVELGTWNDEPTTVVLDPGSGTERARYSGRQVASDQQRVHLQTGTYEDPGVLRTVDREGRTLWELNLPDAIPGGHPQVSTLLGRLVIISDTHLVFLDPA